MHTLYGLSPQVARELAERRDTIATTLLPAARDALAGATEEVKADWYDRAGYDAALEEVLALEGELARLDDQLAEALSAAPPMGGPERAQIGTTLTLRDLDTGICARYDFIESVVLHGAGTYVTAHSPLGQRLLGRRVGEIVEAAIPGGVAHYRIEELTWTAADPAPPSHG